MSAKLNKKFHRTDIHQVGFWYKILRPLVDLGTFMSFHKVEVTGKENIPTDGAVIFAPNHCNTLMDALVVLRTRRGPTVFGARADMFENPTVAKILHFLKIVPIVRKRDGIRKVIRNLDIIDDIVEVLGENVPFCIFPEGTHRPKHSLLTVGKGVFRISMKANENLNKPIYVVPVGIEYSDYYRFGGTSLVQFGEPIPVSEYKESHSEALDAEMYRSLTATLRGRLEGLITYIPDDEEYDARWAYTKIMAAGPKSSRLTARLKKNKEIIADIDASKLPAALEFDNERLASRISYKSLGFRHPALRTVLKTLGLLLWLPLQILNGIFALPSVFAAEYMIANKFEDKAFSNSLRMAAILIVNGILLIVLALVFIFSKISFWKVGVPVLVFLQFAPLAFYSGLEWYRVWLSDIRLLGQKSLLRKFSALRK